MQIAQVNLPFNVKTLWFDPQGLDITAGDYIVVETARGIELGRAAGDLIDVTDEEIAKLKTPLKPVLRLATDEDIDKDAQNKQRAREAYPVFKELAAEQNPDMHPISVEFLLDGDKAVFYFESEKRIDFRELVRLLAAKFKIRVDMRQMGVRDEARIVGGLGHCGQEICCKRLGGEFKPVSIRMAKDQDLSLNPQKISGLCGRLMCCLRYEQEAYKDFNARCPKMGATIQTPDGAGKIVEINVPRETLKIKVEDEKPVKVALADLETSEGARKPDTITSDAWEDAKNPDTQVAGAVASLFVTSQFTGTDKLGSAVAVHHESSSSKDKPAKQREQTSPSAGSRHKSGGRDSKRDNRQDRRKPSRRRRSTKISTDLAEELEKRPSLRPGRKSSSLAGSGSRQEGAHKGEKSGAGNTEDRQDGHRRKRNRKADARENAPRTDRSRQTSHTTSGDAPAKAAGDVRQRRPRRSRTVHVDVDDKG